MTRSPEAPLVEPFNRFILYSWPALLIVAGVGVIALLVWLAWLPGETARRRHHPQAYLIATLGWISLVVWPLWPLAFVWARRGRGPMPKPQFRVRITPHRYRPAIVDEDDPSDE